MHGNEHAAYRTAGNGSGRECSFYNGADSGGYCCNIADDQDNSKCKIQNSHERNDDLADTGNSLYAADEHCCHTDREQQGGDDYRPGILAQERQDLYGMDIGRIKESVDGTGDTVDLAEGTDAEETYADTEESKKLCQPFPTLAHAFLNVIEGTAQAVPVGGYRTIFDGQKTFRVLGGHAQEGCHDHPEQSTGTAGADSSGNTYDIAGADGGT